MAHRHLKHKSLKVSSYYDLEQQLLSQYCESCPIFSWRLEAAARQQNVFIGYEWDRNHRLGIAMWLYPEGLPKGEWRNPKYIVVRAPTLSDLCGCRTKEQTRCGKD